MHVLQGRQILWVIKFVTMFLTLIAANVLAVPTNWTNPGAGNFSDTANWDAGVPGSSDDPTIDNGGTAEVNNQIDGSSKEVQFLTVGRSTTGTIEHTEGTLIANSLLLLGQQGSAMGTYNISGGRLRTERGSSAFASGTLIVGFDAEGVLNVGPDARVETSGVGENEGDLNIIVGRLGGGEGTLTTEGTVHSDANILVGEEGNGTLNINGGTVTAIGTMILGVVDDDAAGIGQVNQTAGDVTVFRVAVGGNTEEPSGVEGIYTLSGGTIQTGFETPGEFEKGDNFAIGKEGLGLLEMTGGSINVNSSFRLGEEGDGTVFMSGGEITTAFHINVADRGTAFFEQSGGTVNAGAWLEIAAKDFGQGRRSNGTYRLTGGTLNVLGGHSLAAGNVNVARNGDALFEVTTNGTANIAGNLVAALEIDGDGTIINSGTINVAGETIIGLAELGQMTMEGGTVSTGGAFKVGQGTEDFPEAEGTVTHTDGTMDIGGWLELGSEAGARGTYNLSGGTINSLGTHESGEGDVIVGRAGTGVFTQTGGILNVSGNLDLSLDGGQGTYNLEGGTLNMNGGVVDITAGDDGDATFNFTGGTLAEPGAITWFFNQDGGILDAGPATEIHGNYAQNAGVLAIDIRGADVGQHDSVSMLAGSHASIGGSLALSTSDDYDPALDDTVDILTAAVVAGTFESIDGVVIDQNRAYAVTYSANNVTIRVTRPGNIDLDDDVDFTDFVAFSNKFGTSGTWVDGDFNGDNQVGFPDFVLLSNNFGATSAEPVSNIPEPSTSCLFLLGMVIVLARRARPLT